MKGLVPTSQPVQDFRADPTAVEAWTLKQVVVVDDQVPVGERIAQPNEPVLLPGP